MKENKPIIRLLLTGGGTGGHLFPALAAARKLLEECPESKVMFVGTKRKMDKKTLDKYPFASRSIHGCGLKGKSLPGIIKALLVLPASFLESLVILLRFKPDMVLGVGGYVTAPVVAAARMLAIPALIHEQNSVPGLANRKLAFLVNKICVSMPDDAGVFPKNKLVLTGNPVRKEILEIADKKPSASGQITILVLGGSQGAHGLNLLVCEAVTEHFSSCRCPFRMIHQTGQNDVDMVRKKYDEAGIQAETAPFFQDMAGVYEQADLVVSRAGATTLAELSVLGKPAVLIPYPAAADNHQLRNAEYYARVGGAVIMEEKKTSPAELADALVNLINNPDERAGMGMKMKELSRPEAAENIIRTCLSLV
ncbi:MAG: undecaprenyldiphospho-muramoylpentapeptide beta-N-acetylglucosaminyltransferase [Deltaproteobacteria bacterium]|nr:MAG: undecaprenyldiphospho-muramoylpentapeptide beta-N-acetylglucosaminyltransferase [Deltaproteobacteria bacterium]